MDKKETGKVDKMGGGAEVLSAAITKDMTNEWHGYLGRK